LNANEPETTVAPEASASVREPGESIRIQGVVQTLGEATAKADAAVKALSEALTETRAVIKSLREVAVDVRKELVAGQGGSAEASAPVRSPDESIRTEEADASLIKAAMKAGQESAARQDGGAEASTPLRNTEKTAPPSP